MNDMSGETSGGISIASVLDDASRIWAQTHPPEGWHYDPATQRMVQNVGAFVPGSAGILVLVAVVFVLLMRR